MKNLTINIVSIFFAIFSGHSQQTYPTIGKVETFNAAFKKLISETSHIEVIATGIKWAEGPVWVKQEGYLLFSDAPQNTIFKWDEKAGLQTFLKPSGYTGLGQYSDEPGSNGLIINNKGNLVACEHGDRRISEMPLSGGGKISLADDWQAKRFNSPNDICQHSNGTYYFTDPPYGLPGREGDTENREIVQNGVYSIDTQGNVKQIIANLDRPNGIALSPDEKTLYVAQSDGEHPQIMQYPVNQDATVGNGSVFFDFSKYEKQLGNTGADGIKIDALGNMYAAAAQGIVVISAKGELLGRLHTGVPTANCAFGNGYLYITAHHYLCRIKLPQ
jgi:gluconolactonase